jgi:hypothetical protein
VVVPLPDVPSLPDVPLLPLEGGVALGGVALGGVVDGVVVDGGVVVSLGGVAGGVVVVVVVVVPVPLVPVVPVVPLVPEVVLGVVLVPSLGVTVVVSVFLQAPSMAAMTAAVRMIFDAFEKAFIV